MASDFLSFTDQEVLCGLAKYEVDSSIERAVSRIPLYVSLASALWFITLLARLLVKHFRERGDCSIPRHGPAHLGSEFKLCPDSGIAHWNILRLISVIGLLGSSLYTAVFQDPDIHGTNNPLMNVPEQLIWLVIYTYSAFLAISVVSLKVVYADVASSHLTVILLSTWGVFVYRDIWPLCTYDGTPTDIAEGPVLWTKIGLLTFSAIVVPLVTPRRYRPLDASDPSQDVNPEHTASILSLVLHSYLDKYIFLGNRLPHLPFEEFPPIADYDKTKNLVKRSFRHIDPTLNNTRRHVFFNLLRVFWIEQAIISGLLVIQVMTTVAIPIGIYKLLDYLSGEATDNIRPIVWVLWLAIGPVLGSITIQWYRFVASRRAVHVEAVLTEIIFVHALRIRLHNGGSRSSENTTPDAGGSRSAKSSTNFVGKLMNLITTNLNNEFLVILIYVPLQLGVCVWFLYNILGWSAFVGLIVIVLAMIPPGYLMKKIQAVQRKRMKKMDARVQIVTEILNMIRMIKIFAWEPKMEEQLAETREEELGFLKKLRILELLNRLSNFTVPLLAMIATFTAYTALMKQQLTASRVFSSIAVFEIVQSTLRMVFLTIPAAVQAKVSLDRINDFLLNTELLDSSPTDEPRDCAPTEESRIEIRNAWFAWDHDQLNSDEVLEPTSSFVLRIDEELKFVQGGINLILGPSGSGKTTLLMALLGETYCRLIGEASYARLPRKGDIAFAAQESWVLSGTIRENILFGSAFDEERYNEVTDQCALRQDLESFGGRDSTEVGERGITLSGGQKARITLARAVYSSASVLLLDDILAALDVRTANHVVDKCLKGDLLRGRTVILVTHHASLVLPIANYAVCLSSTGNVLSQGSPEATVIPNEIVAISVGGDDFAYDDDGDLIAKPSVAGATATKLTVKEEVSQGHIGWKSLKLYFSGLGGNAPAAFWCAFIGGTTSTALIQTAQAWYLGYWARQYELRDPREVSVAKYLSVYSGMLVAVVITYMSAFIAYMFGAVRASRVIHQSLVHSVLGSTMRWLDKTPMSRVITRCTQDIQMVDGPMAQHLGGFIEMSISMLMKFAAIMVVSPQVIVVGLLVWALGWWISQVYIKTQLSVKRETSNARAPVLSHFGAMVAGLVSIRAYGAQEAFVQESYRRVDNYTRAAVTAYNVNRWVSIRIEMLGGLSAAALAAYLVYWKDASASNTGFSLSMAVGFSGSILWWVRGLNEFEVSANSLERIQQYLVIEQEPKPTPAGVPPAYWPATGELVVRNLSARYSEDGPKVLKDISFHVKSGERVGIVGRTGSGKSTLTLSLLRCIPTEGEVLYDGIPTSSLNLDTLRSNITMIPQSPELLSGTVRQNLDPFMRHTDAELNEALRSAGVGSASAPAPQNLPGDRFVPEERQGSGPITLDTDISGGGLNISVGQRQILALARAIVRQSKLLILDEATSSIDHETDGIIQTSLRNRLGKDVTLLIVAHRLQTVMDADKILVLDAGRIVEFGKPSELLRQESGMMKMLVDQSTDRDRLYAMAYGTSE